MGHYEQLWLNIYINFFQNASIHQSVLTLRATDQDDGSNAEFTFEFKNGTQVISIGN